MDCCDVLDDALCRLQRKFLHAKRHEDDDHDPAQDRQQTIRPVSRFRDVEIILRVNHGVFWLSLRLMRKLRLTLAITHRNHGRYARSPVLSITKMCRRRPWPHDAAKPGVLDDAPGSTPSKCAIAPETALAKLSCREDRPTPWRCSFGMHRRSDIPRRRESGRRTKATSVTNLWIHALIKSVKMMDRPVTVTDAEAIGRRDGGIDPGLGIANGSFDILAFGKAGGDGGGQRTSGAMGVAGGDARCRQRERAVISHAIVDALVALRMAALDQNGRTAHRQQPLALARDGGFVRCDRLTEQGGGFQQVRRDQ